LNSFTFVIILTNQLKTQIMKKLFLLFVISCSVQQAMAQVPKKIVVEHFTNTLCSICKSRNPGFYSNLGKQTGVIHLAIHPSSPYKDCALNKQNVAENDGRTNYYGVYGSTPVLVIQGVEVSGSANYSSAAIFTPYLNKTSPASIRIVQTKFGKDSIRSKIVIKTEAAHALGSLSLFVALAEDTLKYSSPNGETVHYDVFRKSLTGVTGISIILPAKVGDSVVFIKSSPANAAWNFAHIYTLAILQETGSKAVVQSQSVPASSNSVITSVSDEVAQDTEITVFSTATGVQVKQEHFTESAFLTLYDVSGRIILNKQLNSGNEFILVPPVTQGIYLYAIRSKQLLLKSGKVVFN
jgi:hypothetical protein